MSSFSLLMFLSLGFFDMLVNQLDTWYHLFPILTLPLVTDFSSYPLLFKFTFASYHKLIRFAFDFDMKLSLREKGWIWLVPWDLFCWTSSITSRIYSGHLEQSCLVILAEVSLEKQDEYVGVL